ncbi:MULTISPECIES: hypothetical protein [unclassified Thioalkalivibrio]|uniref:hypothetical protein n=1 Tax=unclassified Thioalkalivibrio TaxID=2621013 RepID=UPI00036ED348|nr:MULTISPECIES: hypothetical protein [unclassified Thioalkalivibrio]
MNSRDLHRIATDPQAYLRFRTTGETPRRHRAQSPLIDLLRQIPPYVRARMRGVQLDPSLGYRSAARFHTAEQLLRWLAPEEEMYEGDFWPGESHRDRRFRGPLTLEDLRPFVSDWPEWLDSTEATRIVR